MAIARMGTEQKTKGFSVAGDIVGKSMFKASPIMKTRSEFVINAGFLIR